MSTSKAPPARHVYLHGEQRKRPAGQAGRRTHHEHALDGAAVHVGQPGKGRPPAARHAHLRRTESCHSLSRYCCRVLKQAVGWQV